MYKPAGYYPKFHEELKSTDHDDRIGFAMSFKVDCEPIVAIISGHLPALERGIRLTLQIQIQRTRNQRKRILDRFVATSSVATERKRLL